MELDEIEIVKGYPPNWEQIQEFFPATKESRDILMTYDGKIYNPFGAHLRDDLIFHEQIHVAQQARAKMRGMTADEWWIRYATNIEARIEFEAQAYGQQVGFIRRKYKKQGEKMALQAMKNFAKFMSGPVYGNVINEAEAFKRIQKNSR